MIIEATHEFETVGGASVRVTLRNTMRQDIRFRLMEAKFAADEHPDHQERSNFCWFVARIVGVEGTDWRPVDETASAQKFEQSYYGLSDLVDDRTFLECALAVNALKSRADRIEKPDSALTSEENADPNS